MAQIVISALPTGVPKSGDLTPSTDPTDLSEAPTGTTKKYVRSDELNFYLGAQGLITYAAVTVATTGALTATYNNGAFGVGATLTNSGAQLVFALDGVTPPMGSRVLVKNEAAPAQNGIYALTNVGSAATNWVLTRSLDYDTPALILQYGIVLVSQGLTQAGQVWQETGAGPFTIGTTAIVFAVYSALSPLLPSLTLGTIYDINGKTALSFGAFPSAINYLTILNGVTGNGPVLGSAGADANIPIVFTTKGTGGFYLETTGAFNQINILSGTGYQHASIFNFANTAASDTYTFPDASGTIALNTGSLAWTPVVTFVTPGDLTVSYALQQGYYSKVGSHITASFLLTFTPTFTTASSGFQITGLPFTSYVQCEGSVFNGASTLAYPASTTQLNSVIAASGSLIQIYASGSGTAGAYLSVTEVTSGQQYALSGTITFLSLT